MEYGVATLELPLWRHSTLACFLFSDLGSVVPGHEVPLFARFEKLHVVFGLRKTAICSFESYNLQFLELQIAVLGCNV